VVLRRGLSGCLALAAAVALATPLGSSAAQATVPRSFFGVVPQGPISAADFGRMQGTIGSVRVPFGWAQAEPRPGEYDFDAIDEIVGPAASHGIRVLPFVTGSPLWLTGDPERPPQATARGRAAWFSFLRRLVSRYGPGGSFWKSQTRQVPIRRWQIWNEPNFLLAWHPRISPRGYARLLGIAAHAIRGVDPGAEIVAAAVAPVEAGMLPWTFLKRMYRVPGVRRAFDVMAANPYASSSAGVEYEIRRVRRVMALAGDGGKPLRVTELGVASDGVFRNPFDKGRLGQARFLKRVYGLLIQRRRQWRISGVDWFAWQDLGYTDTHCVFCQYTGLFDVDGAAKPAWHALRHLVSAASSQSVR
jgi:hypothetical protein